MKKELKKMDSKIWHKKFCLESIKKFPFCIQKVIWTVIIRKYVKTNKIMLKKQKQFALLKSGLWTRVSLITQYILNWRKSAQWGAGTILRCAIKAEVIWE